MKQAVEGMTLVRALTWNEVFDIWRSLEAGQPHWKPFFQERGWSSWEEWRSSTIAKGFRLSEHDWTLYRVKDPMVTIPSFRGGPFRTWITKAYDGKSSPTPTFADLAATDYVRTHDTIRKISEQFPNPTTLIGLRTSHGIVVVEGTHRSCAVALAASEGRRVTGDVTIALADYAFGDLPIVGGERKKTA